MYNRISGDRTRNREVTPRGISKEEPIITQKTLIENPVLSDGLFQVLPDGTITSTFTAEVDNNGKLMVIKNKDITDKTVKPLLKYPALLFSKYSEDVESSANIHKYITGIPEPYTSINTNIRLIIPHSDNFNDYESTLDIVSLHNNDTCNFTIKIVIWTGPKGNRYTDIKVIDEQKNEIVILTEAMTYSAIDFRAVLSADTRVYRSITFGSYSVNTQIHAPKFDSMIPGELWYKLSLVNHANTGSTDILLEDILINLE